MKTNEILLTAAQGLMTLAIVSILQKEIFVLNDMVEGYHAKKLTP